MPIDQNLADEGRRADVVTEALRREVAATLGLLAQSSTERSGQFLMPLRFRFALTDQASRPGVDGVNREIVVSVSAEGLEIVGPAEVAVETGGPADGR